MSFKVGDVVEIIGGHVSRIGLAGTIIECEAERPVRGGAMYFGYCVKIPDAPTAADGDIWQYRREWLRRKPPKADYDGNQAGSWDLIPWQPNKMRQQA